MIKKELISSENLQMPEGKYTFGIPTRSDVKDPRYKKATMLKELDERINPLFHFNWPVPSEFNESANPHIALDVCLKRVSRYKEALLEAEPYLPYLKKDNYTKETTEREKILPEGVKEKKITLKWAHNELGWRYTFNPGRLLTNELNSLEADFKAAVESEENPARKIRKLNLAIKTHEENPVKEFVEWALRIDIPKSPFYFENDPKTEAGQLKQINEQIAQKSDIYLHFDEGHLIMKVSERSSDNFPFCYIFDTKDRFTQHALHMRVEVRDFIEERLKVKGEIVINGICFKEKNRGIISDSLVPLWLINLFAQPVLAGGKVLEPEEWALKEKEMVDAYRVLDKYKSLRITHPDMTRILNNYSGLEDSWEVIDNKRRVENLRFCLVPDKHLKEQIAKFAQGYKEPELKADENVGNSGGGNFGEGSF